MLTVSIFFSPLLAGLASADGIPMVPQDAHAVLRENRQLAHIKVLDENMQRMDLFLSVVSLELDNDYIIAVPLRTQPSYLDCKHMTDENFIRDHEIDKIELLNDKQNKGFDEFKNKFVDIQTPFATSELTSLPSALIFTMMGGMLSGGSAGDHYEFDGVSIDVYSLDSYESLQSLYDSLDLPVPQNVNETISQYSAYNVAIVKATSKPPIPEWQFTALLSNTPEAIEDFKEFVKSNPVIKSYEPKYGDKHWSTFHEPELDDILQTIPTYELREYFANLVRATYGMGTQEGYQLRFEMPLYNNQTFFPLGTSPAWHAVSQIEIVFEVSDEKEIQFNKQGSEVFYNDHHYYIWEFENTSPDYDLEGEVVPASFGTAINQAWHGFNEWIYDNSLPLAVAVFIIINILIWFAVLWIAARYMGWQSSRASILSLFLYGCFGAVLSIFLSIFVMVPIVISGMLSSGEFVTYKSMRKNIVKPDDPTYSDKFLLGTAIAWIFLMAVLVSSIFVPLGFGSLPSFILWGFRLLFVMGLFILYDRYRQRHKVRQEQTA